MKLALILSCILLAGSVLAETARPRLTIETSAGPENITAIYHATVLIEAAGKEIYLDPAKPANLSGMPAADLILITDIHGDHLDPQLIAALSKPGTEIWAPAAVAKTLPGAKIIGNGETRSWNGWSIEAVAMYNLTRGPEPGTLYHPKGRGDGFILTYGGKRIYFSGDTEVTQEMRTLKNIDVAFVCMNLPYTMTPAEAAQGIKAFHPKIVIPYHYRGQDTNVLDQELKGTGIEVRHLEFYPK